MVSSSWAPVVVVDLTEDQNVGEMVEGIGEDANWFQHTVRVVSLGLAS